MPSVREMMTTNVETATLKDNMYEVAVKMKERNVGAIPIVDGKRPIGIITDRDIVIRGTAERKPGSTAVEEIMTKDPVTISPTASAEEASEMMAERQIRRLIVVENGEMVGILAMKDLTDQSSTLPFAHEAIAEISETRAEHQSEMRH